MDMFKSGDYKAAAGALQEFVRRFPDSAYAANAQYWLGNAYYAQRDYKNAIAAQEAVVSNYGTSAKAPDAMLNIASSYTELKDKKKQRRCCSSWSRSSRTRRQHRPPRIAWRR
jgi:tol-pal system protein YbgF